MCQESVLTSVEAPHAFGAKVTTFPRHIPKLCLAKTTTGLVIPARNKAYIFPFRSAITLILGLWLLLEAPSRSHCHSSADFRILWPVASTLLQ